MKKPKSKSENNHDYIEILEKETHFLLYVIVGGWQERCSVNRGLSKGRGESDGEFFGKDEFEDLNGAS